jgi:hypothetical protein
MISTTAARIRCRPGSEPGPGGPDLVGIADRVSTAGVDRRAFKLEIRILAATLPASIRDRRAFFALVGPFRPPPPAAGIEQDLEDWFANVSMPRHRWRRDPVACAK